MNANELSREISRWIREYQFCGKVRSRRTEYQRIVEFEARTTKTRASSMVTRIGLIAMEVAATSRGKIFVGKELVSEPPATRDSLASWRIYATIPIGRRVDPLQRDWEERFGRSTIYPQLRLQGEP